MATRKTAQAKQPDIEVLDAPATNPDHQLIKSDGDKLREFLGGLARFFARATEIERSAKERLDQAKQLTPPADAASDERIQVFIREAKDDIKVAEDHWSIAAVLHHLHRAVTTARSRATGRDSKGTPIGYLDQAVDLAQRLHNRYVDEELRRVREEEERERRVNEQRAAEERERELERIEQEALKAEANTPDLSERETTFVDAIIRLGQRPAQAAHTAGFKNPANSGERLMSTAKIVQALDAKKQAATIREQAEAERRLPLRVAATSVRPNISRASGTHDRTTHGAEVFDENALLAAALDPILRTQLGIPADVLMINRSKVNDYGGSLKELINKWPGVRYTKKTSTI